MKLAERKTTTQKGLKQAEKLMNSFDFADDVEQLTSNTFNGLYNHDNNKPVSDYNYHEWTNRECYLRILGGKMEILSVDSRDYTEAEDEVVYVTGFKNFDFEVFVEEVKSIIGLYNVNCREKDEQIQEFLNFCDHHNSYK
jgi:hypothetical protein